jgi:hypothetical protein
MTIDVKQCFGSIWERLVSFSAWPDSHLPCMLLPARLFSYDNRLFGLCVDEAPSGQVIQLRQPFVWLMCGRSQDAWRISLVARVPWFSLSQSLSAHAPSAPSEPGSQKMNLNFVSRMLGCAGHFASLGPGSSLQLGNQSPVNC